MQDHEWGSGELVRVGTPQIRNVANDDRVSLRRLVMARSRTIEERRRSIERGLTGLVEDERRMVDLDAALRDYDHGAYLEARTLLATEARVAGLAERVLDLRRAHAASARAFAEAEAEHERAVERWDDTADARAHLADAGRMEEELAGLERSVLAVVPC